MICEYLSTLESSYFDDTFDFCLRVMDEKGEKQIIVNGSLLGRRRSGLVNPRRLSPGTNSFLE